MSWLNKGESKRLKDPEWEHTVQDLTKLMFNFKTAVSEREKQEFASRAISFVLGNLERRGIIEDQFELQSSEIRKD